MTPDWHADPAAVDRHNGLVSGVAVAVADFMDAQRRCANAILARYTTYTNPAGIIADQTTGLPGRRRGELGDTLLDALKGLTAWDEWQRDPARAAGMATVNILTAVLGTKGAGTALWNVPDFVDSDLGCQVG